MGLFLGGVIVVGGFIVMMVVFYAFGAFKGIDDDDDDYDKETSPGSNLLRDGVQAAKAGYHKSAIDRLTKYLTYDDNNAKCHEYLSSAYSNIHQYDLAKKHADIAIRLSPHSHHAHVARSQYYRSLTPPDWHKSLSEAKSAISINSDEYIAHADASIAYAAIGEFTLANSERDIVKRTNTAMSDYLRDWINECRV